MKEIAYEREQVEQQIAIARMEAADEALPKSFAESLDIIKALRIQLEALATNFEKANSRSARRIERVIGFLLGISASLFAAGIWWFAAGFWPVLKS